MPMIYGMERAIMPTIIPMVPQISESLAAFVLPGSPAAVKNKKPATKNIIMAKPTNTGQMKFITLTMICQKSFTLFIESAEGTAAKDTFGIESKNSKKETDFLFIFQNVG